jgi:hypothetical protein
LSPEALAEAAAHAFTPSLQPKLLGRRSGEEDPICDISVRRRMTPPTWTPKRPGLGQARRFVRRPGDMSLGHPKASLQPYQAFPRRFMPTHSVPKGNRAYGACVASPEGLALHIAPITPDASIRARRPRSRYSARASRMQSKARRQTIVPGRQCPVLSGPARRPTRIAQGGRVSASPRLRGRRFARRLSSWPRHRQPSVRPEGRIVRSPRLCEPKDPRTHRAAR